MPTDPSAAAHSSAIADDAPQRLPTLMLAAALSLGSAIALGFARFAYALLLPSMKQDLGWTFAEAGAMNTANALGYLLGALAFPHLARRWRADTLCVAGCAATALLMAASGLVAETNLLLLLRVITGMASAAIFISGGVLAARLASARPRDAGLVLGLYYGGTGWGIVASSVLVPFTIADRAHGWQLAWFALAAACALFTVAAVGAAHRIGRLHAMAPPGAQGMAASDATRWPRFAWVLAGYGLFGVGYIGYMTFIVALLRNAGMSAAVVTGFYLLLGVATVFSARLWSGLLDRMRGGQALAALNALLAIATLLPALFTQAWIAFASGALFGATFLSAVASTTAFVRHNLPASHWAKGISAFTIVFAFGQIVGPMVIGWVSDGAGLARGLIYSALLLAGGALLAVCQKPLRAD
ncbi:YbfB/YjiJ family MFS transporter [bacterium M00.F.Ca.ET.228.01.1.1]|uniref:YbfB/YjiJ family MFS transporter n=1 Tax=Paraburkholderia phenoliruptrix TaxID=252970 RepID=UPI001092BE2D|nr:YbfB/YjiJ family MFS transporter [Paraburkholderia phenoliruptrix]TGP47415.1 YbfB/YjiJ family MFS transporter [bacterium M00.F.Ca.ET.228.01.1.1]TGS05207.1 YbfB/YjiJ family MFS transporter [bacterium M00.F.Ca.ET.191.01.1.1]TGU10143.1 YbfB/YjiJ family MFS transporter [bacterium M00.F.Ca.ET.155.01.1.1]MBW0449585.1 YbfB/YjiJ family MFS transporter [Paraburkholderia phenoliruptrix]MBW9101203.1 YbfB/YjiJ family MFS transporter [Paraburkholderia phenoliruptrix]